MHKEILIKEDPWKIVNLLNKNKEKLGKSHGSLYAASRVGRNYGHCYLENVTIKFDTKQDDKQRYLFLEVDGTGENFEPVIQKLEAILSVKMKEEEHLPAKIRQCYHR